MFSSLYNNIHLWGHLCFFPLNCINYETRKTALNNTKINAFGSQSRSLDFEKPRDEQTNPKDEYDALPTHIFGTPQEITPPRSLSIKIAKVT